MEQGFRFILETIALLAVIAGTAFSVIGILGYIRLPDVYTRLHATGKVGVFGVVLLLIAAVETSLLGLGKGLALILMLMVSGPAVTHAIASAAYRMNIPMEHCVRDDLGKRCEG